MHVTLGLVGRSNYPYPTCNQHGLRSTQRSANQSHHCRECGMPPPLDQPSLPTRHQTCTFSGTRCAHTRNRRDTELATPAPEHAPSIGVRIVATCGTRHSQVYPSVALLSPDGCTVPESASRGGRRRRYKSISKEQTSALHHPRLHPRSLSRTWPAGAMPTPSLTESCVGPPRAAATVVSPSVGSGAARMGASRDVRVREEAHRTQRLSGWPSLNEQGPR